MRRWRMWKYPATKINDVLILIDQLKIIELKVHLWCLRSLDDLVEVKEVNLSRVFDRGDDIPNLCGLREYLVDVVSDAFELYV